MQADLAPPSLTSMKAAVKRSKLAKGKQHNNENSADNMQSSRRAALGKNLFSTGSRSSSRESDKNITALSARSYKPHLFPVSKDSRKPERPPKKLNYDRTPLKVIDKPQKLAVLMSLKMVSTQFTYFLELNSLEIVSQKGISDSCK